MAMHQQKFSLVEKHKEYKFMEEKQFYGQK